MFRKILVAVDGYAPSMCAADKAVHVAQGTGAQVFALQVAEELPLLPEEKEAEEAALTVEVHTKTGDLEVHVENPLDIVTEFGRSRGVTVTPIKRTGLITATILAVSEEVDADLIVVGDSGLRGLKKLYFGSVARAVSEKSPRPVLIMKTDPACVTEVLDAIRGPEVAPTVPPVARRLDPAAIRRNLTIGGGLTFAFALLYFTAAVMTSAPYKDVAARMVAGLPLAFWTGLAVLLGGVVASRVYLVRSDHEGGK